MVGGGGREKEESFTEMKEEIRPYKEDEGDDDKGLWNETGKRKGNEDETRRALITAGRLCKRKIRIKHELDENEVYRYEGRMGEWKR